MIPGVTIEMAGREWTVPPLTLGQLRQLMPKIRQLSDVNAPIGESQIAILVEIVSAALQRNYPDVTSANVENLLDLGNAGSVLNAVLTGSGLKQSLGSAGERLAPERVSGAMTEASALTGERSTGFSPLPVDIASR